MATRRSKVEFIKSPPAFGLDGSPRAATYYVFTVDDNEMTVEVSNAAIMTHEGNPHPDKVKAAAQAFLEREIDKRGSKIFLSTCS